MPCTTILVGNKASYNGSTMIARNDDGHFDVKKLIVINPKDQPKVYKSVISKISIALPDNPMRYTACPSVDTSSGIWAACGINQENIGMTATETITTNPRVFAIDPLTNPKKKSTEKNSGGIGEEDFVVLVLPYIHSAREGVLRLGALLEQYGTYESNGIAFNDEKEIWWLETIGGHHWIARRVEDNECVIMPNQFGLDHFDFQDAYGKKEKNLCSKDLKNFVEMNFLNLNNDDGFNPRYAFGSHTDSDHVYNTPRAWFMGRYFLPRTYLWDGPNADFTPESDDIPWSFVPEKKITVEDIKYVLSSYYQGTPYNPYSHAESNQKGIYRTIGISRTGVMAILEIRPNMPDAIKSLEWICFGSNAFNTIVPLYTNVTKMPKYVSCVTLNVSTDNFYWSSRLIGALADAQYGANIQHVERYQASVVNQGRQLIHEYDQKMMETSDYTMCEKANEEICEMAKNETIQTLNKVLLTTSEHMKNSYSRSDN